MKQIERGNNRLLLFTDLSPCRNKIDNNNYWRLNNTSGRFENKIPRVGNIYSYDAQSCTTSNGGSAAKKISLFFFREIPRNNI